MKRLGGARVSVCVCVLVSGPAGGMHKAENACLRPGEAEQDVDRALHTKTPHTSQSPSTGKVDYTLSQTLTDTHTHTHTHTLSHTHTHTHTHTHNTHTHSTHSHREACACRPMNTHKHTHTHTGISTLGTRINTV